MGEKRPGEKSTSEPLQTPTSSSIESGLRLPTSASPKVVGWYVALGKELPEAKGNSHWGLGMMVFGGWGMGGLGDISSPPWGLGPKEGLGHSCPVSNTSESSGNLPGAGGWGEQCQAPCQPWEEKGAPMDRPGMQAGSVLSTLPPSQHFFATPH